MAEKQKLPGGGVFGSASVRFSSYQQATEFVAKHPALKNVTISSLEGV